MTEPALSKTRVELFVETLDAAREAERIMRRQVAIGEQFDAGALSSAEYDAEWDKLDERRRELAWQVVCAVNAARRKSA